MYAVKSFKGAQLDFQHFKGGTIRDYEIEFLNDDCTALDIGIYEDIQIIIRYKRGGTIINTYSILNGDITFVSPENNFVYWTADLEDFEDLPRLEYWHDCLGILASGKKDPLFYGVSDLT